MQLTLHGRGCCPTSGQRRQASHLRTSGKSQRAGRLGVAQVDAVEVDNTLRHPTPVNERLSATTGVLSSSNTAAAAPAPAAASSAAAAAQQRSSLQPGTRPYIPQVDLPQLLDSLLGDPDKTLKDNTLLGSALVTDGGPARLFSPLVPRPPGSTAAEDLPLMFYMPGIDGTGLAAYRQFPRLTRAFDLRCLIVPRTDRSTFEQLVDDVAALMKQELDQADAGRPVYLLGESFGGILCLALAIKLGDYIDRVVLVNPASSFSDSIWPQAGPLLAQLPPDVYKLLPFALAPVLSNPISMAMNDVDDRAPLLQQGSDLLYGLIDLAPQLAALRLVLPPETLAWRLELLKQGSQWIKPRFKDVKQRVLVLSGEKDLLIPSKEEAQKLGKALPRARTKIMTDRSHALLQEAGVDLVNILQSEGFYVSDRRMSNGQPSISARDGGGASYGLPRPIQLPTARELELDSSGFVSTINRLTSPVFYSTRPDGQIVKGLSGVPVQQRPVLLIGNHQFFAGDMYPMIQEFIQELGVLPRGLAHPIVFAGPDALTEAGRRGGMIREEQPKTTKDKEDDRAGAAQFSSLLSTYGAVPVNGKNMHQLLSQGEVVLLYPGGAREAFKRKNEAYKLIWPGKAEFVRMAAKFGATIVPFAAIGCDEAITTWLSGEELEQIQANLPKLPFSLPIKLPVQQSDNERERRPRNLPRARKGVNATIEDVEAFQSPGFFTPNLPQRTYFIFRQPIHTDPPMANDRQACQQLYEQVTGEVEDGLGYLLRKRQQDPYKDLLPRLIYEATWGGKRKAPSFEP